MNAPFGTPRPGSGEVLGVGAEVKQCKCEKWQVDFDYATIQSFAVVRFDRPEVRGDNQWFGASVSISDFYAALEYVLQQHAEECVILRHLATTHGLGSPN